MTFHVVAPNPMLYRTLKVSRLWPGRVHEAAEADVTAAGRGIVAARALWAWGADTVLYSIAGGHGGRQLRGELEMEGIPHVLTPVRGELGVVVRIVETQPPQRVTELHEPGPRISLAEQQALVESVREALGEGDWLVLSGALPPGASPALYLACMLEAQGRGCRVALDVPGEVLAALLKASAKPVDVARVRGSDLGAASGLGPRVPSEGFALLRQAGTVREGLKRLQEAGVVYPVLSLGPAGAAIWVEGTVLRTRAPEVDNPNPAGCGDVFLAALLMALDEQGPRGALRVATALAAEKAARQDDLAPAWEDAQKHLPQVRFEGL